LRGAAAPQADLPHLRGWLVIGHRILGLAPQATTFRPSGARRTGMVDREIERRCGATEDHSLRASPTGTWIPRSRGLEGGAANCRGCRRPEHRNIVARSRGAAAVKSLGRQLQETQTKYSPAPEGRQNRLLRIVRSSDGSGIPPVQGCCPALKTQN